MIQRLGPWFQNLHFDDGTQTAPHHPLGDYPRFKWRQLAQHLPLDLAGVRVLEIGCNAGYYACELARRGAHVTGIDHEPLYLEQARWAAKKFELEARIRLLEMEVYDLARLEEIFDIVLFMGVFYHLRHPLLGLELAAQRSSRSLIFQSLTLPGEEEFEVPEDLSMDERATLVEPGWPKMAFIEKKMEGDATNWWVPNHAAIMALLRSVGFTVTARPGHELYICERRPDAVGS